MFEAATAFAIADSEAVEPLVGSEASIYLPAELRTKGMHFCALPNVGAIFEGWLGSDTIANRSESGNDGHGKHMEMGA